MATFVPVQTAGVAFPRHTGRRGLQDALALAFILRLHRKNLRQPSDYIASVFGRDFRDEMLPRCREIQIGAGRPHSERIPREIGGVALKEIVDIRSPAQKNGAQDQGLHGFRMGDGVSQSERASPTAAKEVHLTVDIELTAQAQHVVDQMRGRVVGECRRGVVVACAGCAFATAALVEKNDPVSLRVEKVGVKLVAPRAWPAAQKHDRLAVFRTVFFPINPVKRVLLDSLMPRFAAG